MKLVSWVEKANHGKSSRQIKPAFDHYLANGNTIFKTGTTPNDLLKNDGLIQYESFQDTVGQKNITISVSQYSDNRSAARAFERWVRFQACCISDEEFHGLMNFQDIGKLDQAEALIVLTDRDIIIVEDKSKKRGQLEKELRKMELPNGLLQLQLSSGKNFRWTLNTEP